MTIANNHAEFEDTDKSETPGNKPISPIHSLLSKYSPSSKRLFGYPLAISDKECLILTVDTWKINCGGAPKGSLCILKLCDRVTTDHPELGNHLLIARILGSAALPVQEDVNRTILQLQKSQVTPDGFTDKELQWFGMRTEILGTFYKDPKNGPDFIFRFGGDVAMYLSPHFYEAYYPFDEDLDCLLNYFVTGCDSYVIGRLRYTESEPFTGLPDIDILFSVLDLIGFRTSIYGMTRLGKSNLMKVLAEMIILSGKNVGQIIFDAFGEYTYRNPQDKTSLYSLYQDRCVRYSLTPKLTDEERRLGLSSPILLGVNFYEQVALGHSILVSLFDTVNISRPDYINNLLEWDVIDPNQVKEGIPDIGDQTHYFRALSMYFSLLQKAGFTPSAGKKIKLNFHKGLRAELARTEAIKSNPRIEKNNEHEDDPEEIGEYQTIFSAGIIYKALYQLHQNQKENAALFPVGAKSGRSYFDELELSLLKMHGREDISGPGKFRRLAPFHDPTGSDIIKGIISNLDVGKTVILDLSAAAEELRERFSTMICKAILNHQIEKFTNNVLEDHYVTFYFEEAHTLFPSNNSEVSNNVYNSLAKHGGKLHIGMVYATQSPLSISPDLRGNSENTFITHLSDDRDIKELTHKDGLEDVLETIQGKQTQGLVLMLAKSHRFALPVQIRKFGLSSHK